MLLLTDFWYTLLPFFLFTCITIVFWSRNPVYGVLAFVTIVAQVALFLLLLDLEFLAYILAIVYIGAIVVLFLFVIMMFKMRLGQFQRFYWRGVFEYVTCGILVSSLEEFSSCFITAPYISYSTLVINNNFLFVTAQYLYNDYFFLTILAGLIMLVGAIGAILLTLTSVPTQNYSKIAEAKIVAKTPPRVEIKNRILITDFVKSKT